MPGAVRFEVCNDAVGLATLDAPDKKVNTLSEALTAELAALVADAADRPLKGFILRSGKAGNFCAGAELTEILAFADSPLDDAYAKMDVLRDVLRRVSDLPFPTVALVGGTCLGGGLELALAFDSIVVVNEPKTLLGLPEVKLGLIPGWGGTQRLPRRIGLENAAKMMASGDCVGADQAVKIRLAAAIASPDDALDAAKKVLADLTRSGSWRSVRRQIEDPPTLAAMTESALTEFEQKLPADAVAARTVVRTIRGGWKLPLSGGLELERHAFHNILRSPEAKQKVQEFFAARSAKKS